MQPVNFEAWSNHQAVQANGFAVFFLFVAAAAVFYILLCRKHHPASNTRTYTRMMIALCFVGLLFLADKQQTAAIFFLLIIVFIVTNAWKTLFLEVSDSAPKTVITGTVILAAATRLPFLSDPLWYDETFTAGIARLPLAQALTVIRADVHPPGFYMLEMLMIRLFGEGEIPLRLVSYIASTLTALAIYRLVLALKMPRETADLSAILVAVLPGQIYYAGEARPYALLCLVAIIAIIAVIENRPILYMLCAAMLPMLHSYGYIYTAVIGLTAIALHRNRNGKTWIAANVPAAVIGLAWLPFMLNQTGDIANGFWLAWTPASSLWLITVNTIGATLENSLYVLATSAAAIGFTIIGLYFYRQQARTPIGRTMLIFVLVPPVIAILISLLWHPIFLTRALLPSSTLLIILWSYAITHASAPDRLTARIILYPSIAILLIGMLQFEAKKPIDEHITNGCRNTDIVYTSSTAVHFVATYESDLPAYIWTGANDFNQTLPPAAKEALGWNQVEAPPPGLICYIAFDTALSSVHEMEYRNSLFTQHPPVWSRQYEEDELYQLVIYHLEVQP